MGFDWPILLLASGLLALLGLLGGAAWRARRRVAGLALRVAQLEALRVELAERAERADDKARLLDGVLAALSVGVSVTDGELRLVAWNPRFSDFSGVPRRALRIGMPMAEVLRLQAEAGEFGLVDPEAEVARRMAQLREGPMPTCWQRERPDGSRVELRRAALPGGGFVTLYSPLPLPSEAPIGSDLAEGFKAEWAARAPRLTSAAADGDVAGARAIAHALRGIAANAGWTALAMTLGTIEAAAEAGDAREVRALAALLPIETPD
jgi:PAS domain-containing protein